MDAPEAGNECVLLCILYLDILSVELFSNEEDCLLLQWSLRDWLFFFPQVLLQTQILWQKQYCSSLGGLMMSTQNIIYIKTRNLLTKRCLEGEEVWLPLRIHSWKTSSEDTTPFLTPVSFWPMLKSSTIQSSIARSPFARSQATIERRSCKRVADVLLCMET